MDILYNSGEIIKDFPGIILVIDKSGTILFSNHLYDHLPDEVSHKDKNGSSHLSRRSLQSLCVEVLQTGKFISLEMSTDEISGSLAYFKCDVGVKFDENGNPCIAVANCIDISDQKRSLEKLIQFESLMNEAQNIAHLGVWEWDVSAPRVRWTDEVYQIFGVEKDSFALSYEGYLDKVHPEDRKRVHQVMTRVLIEQIPFSYDQRIVRPDGSIRYLETRGHPIFNASGKLIRILGICLDVTDRKKAEFKNISTLRENKESIERSHSLLKATLESTADGILALGENEIITEYNQMFLKLWRIPEEALKRNGFHWALNYVLNQLKNPEACLRRLNEIQSHPERESYDILYFKDGRVFERYTRPQRVNNKIIGRVYSYRDITAKVEADLHLKESEARKTAILTSALDSIISMDDEGKIVEMNTTAEKTFGYSRSYALGKKLSELIMPPDLRTAYELGLKHYLETKEERFLGKRIELSAMRADGTTFPAEVSVVRISADGKPTFTGFIRDISERKKNEELIKKASERMRSLVDATRSFAEARLDLPGILNAITTCVSEYFQDGCIVRFFSEDKSQLKTVAFHHVDPTTRYIMAPILEKTHKYIDGRAIAEILKSEKPILITGDPKDLRHRLPKEYWPFFSRFPIHSWVVIPLRVGDQMIGTVGSFRYRPAPAYSLDDTIWLQQIADRASLSINNAQLYLEAQRSIQLREDFMAIASHELKTPLTPLRIQLQLLSHLVKTGIAVAGPHWEKLKKVISESDQQILRLTHLVEDILDATRLRTGRLTFRIEEVDLNLLISGVIDQICEAYPKDKCTITFEPNSIPTGQWDRTRIEQVLVNLITNALKFGEGKPIHVTTFVQNHSVCFSVKDLGIGIASRDQERIFNRLERAVSYRQFGGLGIGLYISKQIIEGLKGKISVESTPGKGSTFTVELPMAQEKQSSLPLAA